MDNIILELKNIEKVYGQKIKTQVLYDINLKVERGGFQSIIGQSGSGKSTLLNIIGTLLTPDTGQVIINGTATESMSPNRLSKLRSKEIGFVFQNHLLLPEFTAIENVLLPKRILSGTLKKEDVEYANYLMTLVGLEKVRNNKALDMSGGQQQRTAIARGLMNKPSLILADEPTGNLDTNTTLTIYDLMREINQSLNTTFLIVTHDRRIAEMADRIIEIADGRIVADLRR